MGNEREALTYIDKALEVDPNDKKLLELKEAFQDNTK
jgi:hypothetical protein